jgi:hypothetical protein
MLRQASGCVATAPAATNGESGSCCPVGSSSAFGVNLPSDQEPTVSSCQQLPSLKQSIRRRRVFLQRSWVDNPTAVRTPSRLGSRRGREPHPLIALHRTCHGCASMSKILATQCAPRAIIITTAIPAIITTAIMTRCNGLLIICRSIPNRVPSGIKAMPHLGHFPASG